MPGGGGDPPAACTSPKPGPAGSGAPRTPVPLPRFLAWPVSWGARRGRCASWAHSVTAPRPRCRAPRLPPFLGHDATRGFGLNYPEDKLPFLLPRGALADTAASWDSSQWQQPLAGQSGRRRGPRPLVSPLLPPPSVAGPAGGSGHQRELFSGSRVATPVFLRLTCEKGFGRTRLAGLCRSPNLHVGETALGGDTYSLGAVADASDITRTCERPSEGGGRVRPDPPQRCGPRGRGIPGGRGLPPPVGVRVTPAAGSAGGLPGGEPVLGR